jgi:hypothetical protein
LDAFDKQKYSEAIDLLNRAERLMHAPVHLLYIARAYVQLGKLVKAREIYLDLSRENLDKAAPRAFKDAVQSGQRELSEVEAKLPHVSVVVQGSASGEVRVMRDSVQIPRELLGIPHPVDPGEYKFQAFADGMESAAATVALTEGSKETVILTLRPSENKGGNAETATGGSGTATEGSLVDVRTDSPGTEGVSGLRIGSYVGFGVGAVGIGLGIVFAIQSGNTRSNADDLFEQCSPGCTEEQKAIIGAEDSDADSQRNLAIASFVVGGVGVAAGVTLLVLDLNRQKEAPAQAGVWPVIGIGYLGAEGRF